MSVIPKCGDWIDIITTHAIRLNSQGDWKVVRVENDGNHVVVNVEERSDDRFYIHAMTIKLKRAPDESKE